MGIGISVTLNGASKVDTYIKWYVGKSTNIPDMKERLIHCNKLLLITILLMSSFIVAGNCQDDQGNDGFDWDFDFGWGEPLSSNWMKVRDYIVEHHPETKQTGWFMRWMEGYEYSEGFGVGSWYSDYGNPPPEKYWDGEWTLTYATGEVTENHYRKVGIEIPIVEGYRSNTVVINSEQSWWNMINNISPAVYIGETKVYIVYGEYPETSNILIRLGLVDIPDEPEREVQEYVFEPVVDIMQMIKDIMQMSAEMREMIR